MNRGSLVGLVIFGLLWTAIVGLFDAFIGREFYRQIRTLNFAETTGTITHSEVTRHRGSKGGTTYGVDIHYTYRVDGQTYQSENYRHGAFKTSGSRWAYEAVERHPLGKDVPVFYDARNPAEAVLQTGINGSDLFILLFMTPFNAVMLGIWVGAFSAGRQKFRAAPAGGVPFWDDGRNTYLRLPRYSPWMAGLATVGLGGFISIFVVGISTGFHPRLSTMVLVWTALLGGGIGLALWQWRKLRQGVADLVIDPVAQSVRLPVTFGRKHPRELALKEIQGVVVDQIEHHSRKGGRSYTYAVTLQTNGGREKLAEWSDSPRAEALAAWLREKLLPAEPAAPPRKNQNADLPSSAFDP
jgi:hypothetical protein